MRKALIHLNHTLIDSLLKETMTVCDMTCGHGFDTEFIAPKVAHVFAFDIQEEALRSTKNRLRDINNITYIHDSFEHVKNYVSDAQLFIFNLGYLPKGDKSITTTSLQTIHTLNIIMDAYPNANIIIMSYIGHEAGNLEYQAIQTWISHQTTYKVIESELKFHDQAPRLFWMYRK
jgi:hypothetical protein